MNPHVWAIQVACTADEIGELEFAIRVKDYIEKNDRNWVKMPDEILRVLTHPAAIFRSVNQRNNILKELSDSPLAALNYVGAELLAPSTLYPAEW